MYITVSESVYPPIAMATAARPPSTDLYQNRHFLRANTGCRQKPQIDLMKELCAYYVKTSPFPKDIDITKWHRVNLSLWIKNKDIDLVLSDNGILYNIYLRDLGKKFQSTTYCVDILFNLLYGTLLVINNLWANISVKIDFFVTLVTLYCCYEPES